MLLSLLLCLPPPAEAFGEGAPPPAPAAQDTPPAPDSGAFDTVEEQVQARVLKARAYFNSGQYDLSIRELDRSYQLRPNPVYQFSIAQCHRRAGRNRQALATYQRFLKEDPGSPLKVETTNYIVELSALVREEDLLEKEKRRPLWRKPWFWGVLATSTAAAAVAVGTGLGVGLRDNTDEVSFLFAAGAKGSGLSQKR